jgi:DNA integrity scanning protein DisA with diadenylate cyclase activity
MIAPGTLIRDSIDNIVRARTGALLICDEAKIRPMISEASISTWPWRR